MVVRPGPAVSIAIRFDEDRFDKDAMKPMLRDFQAVLQAIVADPDQHVLELVKVSGSANTGVERPDRTEVTFLLHLNLT